MSEILDNLVIGGGLMGSSAAWHLAELGQSVLLLEKQGENYNSGSSYGEARITREGDRNSDTLSYMHKKAVTETLKLVDYLNIAFPGKGFSMDTIYRTTGVNFIYDASEAQEVVEAMNGQNVNYQVAVDSDEAKKLFALDLPAGSMILREEKRYTGTLNPQKLIDWLHRAIKAKKQVVSYNQQVLSFNFSQEGSLYEVKVRNLQKDESYTLKARKVIVAAGPYVPGLLKEVAPYFTQLIDPKRVFLAFYQIRTSFYDQLSQAQKNSVDDILPVVNISQGGAEEYFGMIERFDPKGHPIFKIGGHYRRNEIEEMDRVWSLPLSDDEKTWSHEVLVRHLNLTRLGITKDDVEFVEGYSCVYSLTGNEIPYVTPLLSEDRSGTNTDVIVIGGLSGIGAKGAMAYGKIAANLLLGLGDPGQEYADALRALGLSRLKSDLGLGDTESSAIY